MMKSTIDRSHSLIRRLLLLAILSTFVLASPASAQDITAGSLVVLFQNPAPGGSLRLAVDLTNGIADEITVISTPFSDDQDHVVFTADAGNPTTIAGSATERFFFDGTITKDATLDEHNFFIELFGTDTNGARNLGATSIGSLTFETGLIQNLTVPNGVTVTFAGDAITLKAFAQNRNATDEIRIDSAVLTFSEGNYTATLDPPSLAPIVLGVSPTAESTEVFQFCVQAPSTITCLSAPVDVTVTLAGVNLSTAASVRATYTCLRFIQSGGAKYQVDGIQNSDDTGSNPISSIPTSGDFLSTVQVSNTGQCFMSITDSVIAGSPTAPTNNGSATWLDNAEDTTPEALPVTVAPGGSVLLVHDLTAPDSAGGTTLIPVITVTDVLGEVAAPQDGIVRESSMMVEPGAGDFTGRIVSTGTFISVNDNRNVRIRAYKTDTGALVGDISGVNPGSFSLPLSGVVTNDTLRLELSSIEPAPNLVFDFTESYTVEAIPAPGIPKTLILNDPTGIVGGSVFLKDASGNVVPGATVDVSIVRVRPFDGTETYLPVGRFTTENFAQDVPGRFDFEGIGPAVVGDGLFFSLKRPDGYRGPTLDPRETSVTAPFLLPDTTGAVPVDPHVTKALIATDLNSDEGLTINLTKETLRAGLRYSTDRRKVGPGELQLTLIFLNPTIEEFEGIAARPSLRIDRPGANDGEGAGAGTILEMRHDDCSDPSFWITTYFVEQGDGSNIKDGLVTIEILNTTDLVGQSHGSIQNTTMTLITIPPKATLSYSKGVTDQGSSIPRVPVETFTIFVQFDQEIDATSNPKLNISSSNSIPSANDVKDGSLTRIETNGEGTLFSFNYTPKTTSLVGQYVVTPTFAFGLTNVENDPTPSNPFFTLDNTQATLDLTYSKPQTAVSSGVLRITATFSEAVRDPTITIDRRPRTDLSESGEPGINNIGPVPQPMSKSTGAEFSDEWFFDYEIFIQNGSTMLDGEARVVVTTGFNQLGNSSISPGSNNLFVIDTQPPAVSTVESASGPLPPGPYPILVTFTDVAIGNASPSITGTPNILVSRVGAADQAINLTKVSDTVVSNTVTSTWTADYNAAAGLDANNTVTVLVSPGTDLAGNPYPSKTFTTVPLIVDSTSPDVVLSYNKSESGVPNGDLVITATFSENIDLQHPPELQVNRPDTSLRVNPFTTMSGGPLVWTTTYDVEPFSSPITLDGPTTINVRNAEDPSGNANNTPTNNIINIQSKQPAVTSLQFSAPTTHFKAGTVGITATFDVGLSVAPQISITGTAGANVQLATNMSQGTTNTIWTFDYVVSTGDDGDALLTIASGQDAAGNLNVPEQRNVRIDNVGPSITSIVYSAADRLDVTAGALTITVTFDESIAPSDVPKLSTVGPEGTEAQGPNNQTNLSMSTTDPDRKVFLATLSITTGFDGTYEVQVSGARDLAGNENSPAAVTEKDFVVDTGGPSVYLDYTQSSSLNPIAVRTGTVSITATFSETMVTSPTIAIDRLGTGNDLAAEALVATASGKVWTKDFTIQAQNGTTILDGLATVTIEGTSTEDGAANSTAKRNGLLIDTTNPIPTFIYSKISSPFTAVSSGTLVITATYDEPVTTTPTVEIAGTPSNINGVSSVTMTGVSSTVFTLSRTISIQSDSTYTITPTSVKDLAGNSSDTTVNNTFQVDTIPPNVTSISYNPPLTGPLSAQALRITATFSEPLLITPNITIEGPFGANVQAATQMSASTTNATWLFSKNLATGNDGTFQVRFLDGKDRAGNLNRDATANNTFSVDTVPPSVNLTYSPLPTPFTQFKAGPFTITATFTEPISSTPTMTVLGGTSSPLNDITTTPMSLPDSGVTSVWAFTYPSGIRAGDDGVFTVTIANGKDASGQLNKTATNRTFRVDTQIPTVALSYSRPSVSSGLSRVSSGSLTITAAFSEPIASTPTISSIGAVAGGSNEIASASMVPTTGNPSVWTHTFTVTAGDDDIFTVTVANGGDPAGNLAGTATNNSFTIDTTTPAVNLTFSQSRTSVGTGSLEIQAVFSEPLSTTPTIAVTGGLSVTLNDRTATSMSATVDPKTFSFTYDVVSGDDGVFLVVIDNGQDLAGNAIGTPSPNTFTIDAPPSVVLSYSKSGAIFPAGAFTITADFNELIISTPNIRVLGGSPLTTDSGLQAMTKVSNTQFTFSYTPPTGFDGLFTVQITNGRDIFGNENLEATNNAFTIDTSLPTLQTLAYSRPISPYTKVSSGSLTITATYSELLGTAPTITVAGGTASTVNDRTDSSMTGTTPTSVFSFTYSINTGDDGLFTVTTASGTDQAGNSLGAAAGGVDSTFTVDTIPPLPTLTASKALGTSSPIGAGTVSITATFNETMAFTPVISISGGSATSTANDVSNSAMTGTTPTTVFTFDYNVASGDDGLFAIAIASGQDLAGNLNGALTANNQLRVDARAPTASLVYSQLLPPFSKIGLGPLTITATFDEPIATTPTLAIAGGQAATTNDVNATSMSPTAISSVWFLTHPSGIQAGDDGTFTVTLASAQDIVGNSLAASTVTSRTFEVDTVLPVVDGFAFSRPVAPFTRLAPGPLSITATFSETVFTPPSIAIAGGGSPAINDRPLAAMLGPVPGAEFTISYVVQSGDDGNFSLAVSGARDAGGNENTAVTTSTKDFVIDSTPPAVISLVSSRPVAPLTRIAIGPLTITATFNEPLAISPTLALSGGGSGASLNDLQPTTMTAASGTTTVWTLTHNIQAGDDGQFTVNLASGLDLASNPNLPLTGGNILTVDTRAPSVTSLSFDKPVSPNTKAGAGSLTVSVVFDEAIDGGAPAPQLRVRRPGLADALVALTGSGTAWSGSYDVATAGTGGALDGIVTVDALGTDGAGNPIGAPGVSSSFVVDTVAPTAALTYGTPDSLNIPAGILRITATFSEPLRSAPSLSLVGPSGSNNVGPVTMTAGTSPSEYFLDVNVARDNPGTFAALLSEAFDAAGNASAAPSNSTLIINPAPPAGSLLYSRGPDPVGAGSLTITAVFSKPIASTSNPALSIVGPTGANNVAGAPMTRISSTVFTLDRILASGNDGDFTVSVTGAADTAGQAATALANSLLRIDTTGPSVTLEYSRTPAIVGATALGITARFNEPVASPPFLTLSRSTGSVFLPATPMTATGDPRVFLFTRTFTTGDDGLFDVTLSGATDTAGNGSAAATNSRFEVDTTPPSVVLTYSQPSNAVPAGLLALTATFTEPLTEAPTIAISGPAGANNRLATAMSRGTTGSIWLFTTNIVPGNSGVFTATVDDGADAAGNLNSPAANGSFTIVADNVPATLTYSRNQAGVSTGPLTITATFPRDLAQVPTIALQGPAGVNNLLGAPMVQVGSAAAYSYTTDILAGNDGIFTVGLSNVRDLVGNTNAVLSNQQFTINTVGIPVSLSFNKATAAIGSGPVVITALFGGPVQTQPNISISGPAGANNRTATPMRGAVPGSVFTFTLDVEGANEGTFTVDVTNGKDVAGNENRRPSNNQFTVDTTAPRVTFSYSRPSAGISTGALTITADFDDGILTEPTITLTGPAGVNNRSGAQMSRASSTRFTFGLVVAAGNDGDFTATVNGATNAAGLQTESSSNSTFTVDTLPPDFDLDSPVGGQIITSAFTASGSVSDRTAVTVSISSADGSITTASLTVTSGEFESTLTARAPITTGPVTVLFSATDAAGNRAPQVTRRIRFDSDADGLPDDFEYQATLALTGSGSLTGLDPVADDDGDGLSNAQEFAQGTNPSLADTDDDGVNDGSEVQNGTDPRTASDNRPTARATVKKPVVKPSTISLNGSTSSDPRGRSLTFRWSRLLAPGGLPSGSFQRTSNRPVAVADLRQAGDYLFSLAVANGSAFRTTPTSIVSIRVADVKPTPRADGQVLLTLANGIARVQLDGGRSFDANGDQLSYEWTMTRNPGLGGQFVSGDLTAAPTFEARQPGAYQATLTVRSQTTSPLSTSGSRTATTAVRILVNSPTVRLPVASAGIDQEVVVNGSSVDLLVQLFGRDSVDPDRPTADSERPTLGFTWRQISGPRIAAADRFPDSRGTSEGAAYRGVDPTVRLRAVGEYVFGLIVRKRFSADAFGPEGAEATVKVRIIRIDPNVNRPPTAFAGFDRSISNFDADDPPVIELNGSGSRDPEQSTASLGFAWTQVRDNPDDPTPDAELSDSTAERPEFIPTGPGSYMFQLVVTDNQGLSSLPSLINIQVTSPQITAPPAISQARALRSDGSVITFSQPFGLTTGTASTTVTLEAEAETSGGTLVYRWRQRRDVSTAATVEINGASTARPTFQPRTSGLFVFELLVHNGEQSTVRRVDVPVDDLRPGRNAGITPVLNLSNQTVNVSDGASTIRLDASSSFDRDGLLAGRLAGQLTYLWRQLSGPSRLEFDRTLSILNLTLPAGLLGEYVFQIVMDDGQDIVTQNVSFEATSSAATGGGTTGGGTTGGGTTGGGSTGGTVAGVIDASAGGGGGGCALMAAGTAASWPDLLLLFAPLLGLSRRRRNRRARPELAATR